MARKLPPWIKMSIPVGDAYRSVESVLKRWRLSTVCLEAKCPNRGSCWGEGTATFMLLGKVCSRNCRFCAIEKARPGVRLAPPDPREPRAVAEAAAVLNLKHVVITSVTRDDIEDGGAAHIAETIHEIISKIPGVTVEALVPDIKPAYLPLIVSSGVAVLAHNLEVVRRLTPLVRDKRASYDRSLEVLRQAKELAPTVATKSSLLLGLGEEREEVIDSMRDLREHGVDFLTLGQYLQPGQANISVTRFLEPLEWDELRVIGEEMGFRSVLSGPLIRSSYMAGSMRQR